MCRVRKGAPVLLSRQQENLGQAESSLIGISKTTLETACGRQKRTNPLYQPACLHLCPRARGRAAMPMESAFEAERGDDRRAAAPAPQRQSGVGLYPEHSLLNFISYIIAVC